GLKELDLSVFSSVDKAKWLELAEDQLKGEDPMTTLSWESHGLSDLAPYYDQSDVSELDSLRGFFASIPNHRWKLYERISVTDEKEDSKKGITALMGGCDGLIFQFDKEINTTALLKGIDTSICDISFLSGVVSSDLPEVT